MMVRLKPKIVETLGSDTMVINPKSFYASDCQQNGKLKVIYLTW